MPAVNAGRANVNQAGKSAGKRRVKRVRAKTVYGPPAPKPAAKPVTVAPADRVTERADTRAKQLKQSVRKAGDAPQDRAKDTATANKFKQTDKYVSDVQASQPAAKRKAEAGVYKKGASPRDTLRKVLAGKPAAKPVPLARAKSQQVVAAPVLKVLDQTTRPLHAIAAGTDAAVQGRNVPKAALKGIKNEDKATFSTVLKHAGVKNKYVRGGAGFILDVGLDPTTYVTAGTGSVGRKLALAEAEKASKKAAKAGLTDEQAKRFGDRAAKQAEKNADQTTGATVKFAGKEIPGVRKATAKASKPARAVGRRVVPEKVRANTRAAAADVNPDIAPAGVSKETSRKAVQATRTARSKSNRGLHEAQQHALGIKQSVGEANYSRIIDAIENGTIGKLPAELRGVAVRVRSQFRHANRQRKQAGIRGGEIKARGKVHVPEVVADTSTSAKAVGKARRAEARAETDLHRAHTERDVHQGRAEVLSRNVGDVRAERAAERGRATKRKVRRTAAPPPPEAQFIHVVRDTGTSASAKMERIREHGLKPTAGVERVYAWGPGHVGRADEFGKNGGATQLVIDARGLEAHGGHDAPTRTFSGRIPPERLWIRNPDGTLTPLKQAADTSARYAAGGHGVRQTATAAKDAAQRLKNAKAAREAAETAHAKTVADAAVQRAARNLAEKTNAKRAAAPKEYIPHRLTDDALEAEEKASRGGVGRKVIRPSSSKARGDNRPLSVLREENPGRYSEDLPNLYAESKAEGATSVTRAELNRRIADLGKDVKKGRDIVLGTGESVYHVLGSDIRKVDSKEAAHVAEKGGKNGRYVVLNDDIVKRAIEGAQPTLQGPGIIKGLDRVQSGFKRVALATPGFHVRNLAGDTQNAYLGQGGHRLPKNMVDAGRVLKAEGRRDKSLRGLSPGKQGEKTLKTGRYGDVTYDQIAEQLGKHGAMRTGYTGRELPELAASGSTGRVKVGRARLPRKVKQALLNREDLPRLTTAVDALKKGATWEEAAQKVSDYHFDYGHLTQFERQFARRAAPFYTFSARNIPLQTKSLVTKPGKFANYQKLREEAAQTSGMEEESQKARALTDQLKAAGVKLPKGWEANLSEWEARNAGVPISWGGHKFTVSMGMPLVDLNEFPGAALGDQINEYYQKGMSLTSPIPKNVIEYMENHSFFFRDEIQRQNAPKVAAPEWVKNLPKSLQQRMGVAMIVDKKTGKKTLGYNAKADYVIKSIPGTPAFLNKLATQGHDRVGKGPAGKTLAFAGVKATPYDPVGTAINAAYARGQEIETKMAGLRQQGISMKNPTPEYTRLNKQLNITKKIAFQGRQAQGYKVLPTQGGPKKGRTSSAGRVKVPGVGGRVRVPGAGGRVKVP